MPRLTLPDAMDRILLMIRAGYPVIYIVSHEEARVLTYLVKIVRAILPDCPNKCLLRWSEGFGLERLQELEAYGEDPRGNEWISLPGMPVDAWRPPVINDRSASAALTAIRKQDSQYVGNSLTVFFDLHPYLREDSLSRRGESMVRPLRNAADELRRYYDDNRHTPEKRFKTIVIVAPTAEGMSTELRRDLIKIEFPLPENDELLAILDGMLSDSSDEHPAGHANAGGPPAMASLHFPREIPHEDIVEVCQEEAPPELYKQRLRERIAGAGRGLTLEDYRLGLNMLRVREHGILSPRYFKDMLDLKATAINDHALEYTPQVRIELGGLKHVRQWIAGRRNAVVSKEMRDKFGLPAPKGIMLCGASGGGKSQLAKLIAKEFGLALLRLDVGALFGMYVGESEERTRSALQMAEVLAPIVLWLDEVDKAFTGVMSGGDNGVSARVFGQFLTWLAEKKDTVFVVATANNFKALLDNFPEFGRKGRFDAIFWVDLPDAQAKQAIFKIYLSPHVDANRFVPTEEACSRVAHLAGLVQIPQEGDILDRFCTLLAHSNVSGNMTGAEIECAVQDALYSAFETEPRTLTADIIYAAVRNGATSAVYADAAPDYEDLGELRGLAQQHGWPVA